MTLQLRFGTKSLIDMHLRPGTQVADCTSVRGDPLADPSAAAVAALAAPLGFPPLTQAVVPGDRVTISVDREIPHASQIVEGVVRSLLAAQIDVADVAVLRSQQTDLQLDPCFEGVEILVHDPRDRTELSYLAASQDAEPVYLNRHLCDADFVIPISLVRPDASLDYSGIFGGLYPTFADEAAQRRSRTPSGGKQSSQQKRRCQKAEEVAWLLGILLSVQVIPGPGDTTLAILAGHGDEVAKRGQEWMESTWSFPVPGPASLVIAGIEGGQDEQTWENFARALYAALSACSEQGTIILCTDMNCRIGPALQRLTEHDADSHLLRQIQRDQTEDAMSAALLLEARDRQHIFLLSGLASEVVEAIGLACITDPRQVQHLSEKHDSCILLANAHRAVTRFEPS